MPKTIVIAGAHSNVGKTRLADSICELIEGAVHIKIGHGPRKKELDNIYYPHGTEVAEVLAAHSGNGYLVIESGQAATKLVPDCLIFLPGKTLKPGADKIMANADILRGASHEESTSARLSERLGLPVEIIDRIIGLVNDSTRSTE